MKVKYINNREKLGIDYDWTLIRKEYNKLGVPSDYYDIPWKAIQEGKMECPEMPHAETIRIMKILDDIRKSWNYEIPWIE